MFMLLNLFILLCYIDKCPLFIAMFLWVLLKYEINTFQKNLGCVPYCTIIT